jgi:uncharacterized damage-inducible protein DinB
VQPTERDFLLQRLNETRDAFLASFHGVSEEQARFKPAPDRWSICDCVEHMAVAETGLFRQLSENSAPASTPTGSREREMAILNSNGGNRDQKAKAPERACPTGRFGSLAEAAKQFAAARGRTIDYVTACTNDLRMRTSAHPLIGPMNCMELLAFIIVHPLRHAQQIREIKQSAGYPGAVQTASD